VAFIRYCITYGSRGITPGNEEFCHLCTADEFSDVGVSHFRRNPM